MESNLVEQVTAKIASLPLEQQREALALIEAMENRNRTLVAQRAFRLKGVTAGPGPSLTLEDLRETRKEMWGEYVESEK